MHKATKLRFHLFILIGSILFTLCSQLITLGRVEISSFGLTLLLMIFQVELYAWIGGKLLNKIEYHSVNEFIKRVLVRLALFYILVITLSITLFAIVALSFQAYYGVKGDHFLSGIPPEESKGFIIGSSIGILIGMVIFFFLELIKVIKREEALRQEAMKYYYETLKTQLKPHFLFNSLNTLSSIIYKDVQLADRYILKLASIYRYLLDQQEVQLVDLSRELEFVADYFFLQQLRDGNRIKLNTQVTLPEKYQILPVSLQLLIENALKHNSATLENPLVIDIEMDENSGFVIVRNPIRPRQQLATGTEIGLKNLKERVKLVTGREVLIATDNQQFSVHIPIQKI